MYKLDDAGGLRTKKFYQSKKITLYTINQPKQRLFRIFIVFAVIHHGFMCVYFIADTSLTAQSRRLSNGKSRE